VGFVGRPWTPYELPVDYTSLSTAKDGLPIRLERL